MNHLASLRRLVGTRPIVVSGASALVIDDSHRLLLQKRTDDGRWGLIGGAIEPGEAAEATARRELLEEAGLEAVMLELVGVYSGEGFYHRYPNGDEVHNIIVAYAVRKASGTPVPCGVEGTELAYFGLDDLPANLSQPDRLVIKGLSGWLNGRRSLAATPAPSSEP